MREFEPGDRCRFVKAHHSMNKILKNRVGDEGKVMVTNTRKDDGKMECQIRFDESDKAYGLWWIAADRLELIW